MKPLKPAIFNVQCRKVRLSFIFFQQQSQTDGHEIGNGRAPVTPHRIASIDSKKVVIEDGRPRTRVREGERGGYC